MPYDDVCLGAARVTGYQKSAARHNHPEAWAIIGVVAVVGCCARWWWLGGQARCSSARLPISDMQVEMPALREDRLPRRSLSGSSLSLMSSETQKFDL